MWAGVVALFRGLFVILPSLSGILERDDTYLSARRQKKMDAALVKVLETRMATPEEIKAAIEKADSGDASGIQSIVDRKP
jgi:hypothetical protein